MKRGIKRASIQELDLSAFSIRPDFYIQPGAQPSKIKLFRIVNGEKSEQAVDIWNNFISMVIPQLNFTKRKLNIRLIQVAVKSLKYLNSNCSVR